MWRRILARKPRVHLVQHVLAVEQRPHLADGFIADARDDAADRFQNRVGCAALVPPILLGSRQLVGDCVPLAVRLETQDVAGCGLVLHVINARADVDQRLEAGMTVTSLTRSPSMYTSRPSRIESRYCWPVRIIATSPQWLHGSDGRSSLDSIKLMNYYVLLSKYGSRRPHHGLNE